MVTRVPATDIVKDVIIFLKRVWRRCVCGGLVEKRGVVVEGEGVKEEEMLFAKDLVEGWGRRTSESEEKLF